MPGRRGTYRRAWWTRERMLAAGALFYRTHGCAPTNDDWWHRLTQFTAHAPGGRSNQGSKRPFPSWGSLAKFWHGMRDFWLEVAATHPALDIKLDKGDMPWSPLEEWFITETVGLIPRDEVVRLLTESGMGRTGPAIKRRLYELGVNSYNRWGWTILHVERVLGVSQATVRKYLAHGELPYFRGAKCVYLDPADLLIVKEYDWTKPQHPPELEDAVRKSLARRLCYALLRFDWRKYAYHQPRAEHEYFTGRVKLRSIPKLPTEPQPTHIKVDDAVQIVGEFRFKAIGAKDRVGRVRSIFWSPQRMRATQKSPARPACWVANVELPKLKPHGRPEYARTNYNIPLYALALAHKPAESPKQLKPAPPRVRRKARMRAVGAELRDRQIPTTDTKLFADGGQA